MHGRILEWYHGHMTVLNLILSIGIPAIVVALIYIGRKLQALDALGQALDVLGSDVKNLRDRFIVVEDRIKTLWKDEFAPSQVEL